MELQKNSSSLDHRFPKSFATFERPESDLETLIDKDSLEEAFDKIAFIQNSFSSDQYGIYTGKYDGWSEVQVMKGNVLMIKVQFAPLLSGEYAMKETFHLQGKSHSRTVIFDPNGQRTQLELSYQTPLYVSSYSMEPQCIFINHLYNLLHYEYEQAKQGYSESKRILLVQKLIQTLFRTYPKAFSFKNSLQDTSNTVLIQKLYRNEEDSALKFYDKRTMRKKLFTELKEIQKTKERAHQVKASPKLLKNTLTAFQVAAHGWMKMPFQKLLGTFHLCTIGLFMWFLGVVKNNIGLSLAMAIYSPFTFFFITQPINPTAMSAVGYVRTQFIGASEKLKSLFTPSSLVIPSQNETQTSSLNTTPLVIPESSSKTQRIPVSSDSSSLSSLNWSDRMSQFKQLQITYESNLQVAARLGRIEQMETQLNFPLIVEASLKELKAFEFNLIETLKVVEKSKGLHPSLYNFLSQELERSKNIKLYFWDRTIRYMLDHLYVVLNEGKDQIYMDYYLGNGFIFVQEFTQEILNEFPEIKKPNQYNLIEKQAEIYLKKYKEDSTLMKRLEKNSLLGSLPKQDTQSLRDKVKRQWEILYLNVNKTQEASNFGLITYTWSVRNAIWSLGAILQQKNKELTLLKNSLKQDKNFESLKASLDSNNRHYESLIHILELEFLSIKQEISTKLEGDLDAIQRDALIMDLKKSFNQRDLMIQTLSK